MLHRTDRLVQPNISMSLSSIYNDQYKVKASKVLAVVKKTLPVIAKHLDFPIETIIHICPIKSVPTRGRHYASRNIVVLDCRLTPSRALRTLCHELVHAEQHKQGRLAIDYDTKIGWYHTWTVGKTPIKIDQRKLTYQEYRELPWEKEAFERQEGIAQLVENELGIVF